jgi:hypothetical protein
MTDLPPIQMLWIGELSKLEKLAMRSFLANGHDVHLYVYDDVAGVPDGVTVCDARAILPKDRIFRYGPEAGAGQGSVANFANMFRYKLLYDIGGWWVDTDVVCLRPFEFDAEYVFGYEATPVINNAVLCLPRLSQLAGSLFKAALEAGEHTKWGETGPQLLTQKVIDFGLEGYCLPAKTFYPIYHPLAGALFKAESRTGLMSSLIKDAYAVHFWNEVLRRSQLNKNDSYPISSVFEQLKIRYNVGLCQDPAAAEEK